MFHWIHHLFNPHCDTCREEFREDHSCSTCEVLERQLEVVNREKRELLQMLDKVHNPPVEESFSSIDDLPKPITRGPTPWPLQKQMLENESRVTAAALRVRQAEIEANKKSVSPEIEKLEAELGIEQNG